MKQDDKTQQETKDSPDTTAGKKDWKEPRLKFVKPELTRHGKVKEVTGGFFGTFDP